VGLDPESGAAAGAVSVERRLREWTVRPMTLLAQIASDPHTYGIGIVVALPLIYFGYWLFNRK
jgi:hypothetical protein